MKALTRMVALVLAMSAGSLCFAAEKGIPEYEGKVARKDGTLHYSYVFLPSQSLIFELDYGKNGKIIGMGHGTYSMGKENRITINWQDGSTERGRFYDRNYRITSHTDKNQVGSVTTGGWRTLSAPDRIEHVDLYIRKVVVPLMQRKASIRRQLNQLDAQMLKHHMEIMDIWMKALD